jgi:hypothetical protein
MSTNFKLPGTTLQYCTTIQQVKMIYEGEGEATSMFENNSTSIGYTHTCVVKLESYVYPNHLNHFFSLAGAANLIKNLFLASTH